MNKLTIEQARRELTTDDKILAFLRQQWNIFEKNTIQVIGKLSANYNEEKEIYYYRINNIKSVDGELLEYPLSDLESRNSIEQNGIYVPSDINNKALKKSVNTGGRVTVSCELILSPVNERNKHNNPLLLKADSKTVNRLVNINNDKDIEIIEDEEGNILIEESVVNYLKETHKEEINNFILNLKNEHKEALLIFDSL